MWRALRASPSPLTKPFVCRTNSTPFLAFVEQLSQVDVEGVEPMTSVTPMAMKERDDKVTDGECAEKMLANAPATNDGFFMVPKVVE